MTVTYTGISAQRKGNNIILIATAPDEIKKQVQIPSCDIRENYQMGIDAFLDQYGDNEDELWDLFHAVENITHGDL